MTTKFRQTVEDDRERFHDKWGHRLEGFTAGVIASAIFFYMGVMM